MSYGTAVRDSPALPSYREVICTLPPVYSTVSRDVHPAPSTSVLNSLPPAPNTSVPTSRHVVRSTTQHYERYELTGKWTHGCCNAMVVVKDMDGRAWKNSQNEQFEVIFKMSRLRDAAPMLYDGANGSYIVKRSADDEYIIRNRDTTMCRPALFVRLPLHYGTQQIPYPKPQCVAPLMSFADVERKFASVLPKEQYTIIFVQSDAKNDWSVVHPGHKKEWQLVLFYMTVYGESEQCMHIDDRDYTVIRNAEQYFLVNCTTGTARMIVPRQIKNDMKYVASR